MQIIYRDFKKSRPRSLIQNKGSAIEAPLCEKPLVPVDRLLNVAIRQPERLFSLHVRIVLTHLNVTHECQCYLVTLFGTHCNLIRNTYPYLAVVSSFSFGGIGARLGQTDDLLPIYSSCNPFKRLSFKPALFCMHKGTIEEQNIFFPLIERAQQHFHDNSGRTYFKIFNKL